MKKYNIVKISMLSPTEIVKTFNKKKKAKKYIKKHSTNQDMYSSYEIEKN